MSIRKRAVFSSVIKSVDREKGTITALVSTNQIDRYGEIILPEAFEAHLPLYLQNPVFLWGHRSNGGPEVILGKALSAEKVENGLLATFEFALEINPTAKMVFELYAGGYLKAFSIGGIAHKMVSRGSSDDTKATLPDYARQALEERRVYAIITELELYEISAVPVPANPGALSTAIKEGALELKREMFLNLGLEEGDQVELAEQGEEGDRVAKLLAFNVAKLEKLVKELTAHLAAVPSPEKVQEAAPPAPAEKAPITADLFKRLFREALAEMK